MNGQHAGTQMVYISGRFTVNLGSIVLTSNFLLVFTQQGYFAILINPTGSTTFGQGLCYE